MCRYSAVTYDGFKKRMTDDPIYREKLASATTASKPELAKEFAIRDFVEHVFHMLRRTGGLDRSVSIGFSDDDRGNVKSVSRYIKSELSKRFDGIKFVVYDTSDRTLAKGRKVCVSGQLNLPGF
jgi:light-regulated signal transduction histidine kinase (bacteriophytochrome)